MRQFVSFVALMLVVSGMTATAVGRTPSNTGTGGWPAAYASSVDPDVALFRPDGAEIAVEWVASVELWQVAPWRRAHVLGNYPDSRPQGHFSPNGKTLVTFGLGPNDPALWDVASGRRLHALVGHAGAPGTEDATGWVGDATFSADGARVLTTGGDSTVRIWDANTGRNLRVLHVATDAAVFSPDGRLVATAHGATTRIWDVATARQLRILSGGQGAFFSPDGSRLVTSTATRTTVWSTAGWRKLRSFAGAAATISADGTLLVLVRSGKTRICKLSSGRVVRTIPGAFLALSPDAKRIVTEAPWDRTHHARVAIWNTTSGRLLHTLQNPTSNERIEIAVFSPNGQQLLTDATRIQEVVIWDVTSGRISKHFH